MAGRGRPALTPRLFTAQDVARFCEVDLKTVHHWAERGKVAHFRTEGRHLRFRRTDVVRFLRAHGYPLPEALVRMKPTVAITPLDSVPLTVDELAKKLASRFATRRFASGLAAIAHVLVDQPDAVVVSLDDPTISGVRSVATLRAEIPWLVIAVVGQEDALGEARTAGAEVVIAPRDTSRLGQELARALAVGQGGER
jgi:excisionase family DNA binding protein